MSISEKHMWAKLRPMLNKIGVATRIENVAATSPPDIIWTGPNGKFEWLELKVKKSSKRVIFRNTQIAWWAEVFQLHDFRNGLIVISEMDELKFGAYIAKQLLVPGRMMPGTGGNVAVNIENFHPFPFTTQEEINLALRLDA